MITVHEARAPARFPRLLSLVSTVALAAALAASPAQAPAAESSSGGTEYVNAVANSSLVHIRVDWKGWLVVPRKLPLWGSYYQAKGVYGPFTATITCSGFVASSTGQVVTAGHCVDADSFVGGKGAVLSTAMAGWHDPQGNPLSPSERTRLTSVLQGNADIEGTDSGSPPERTVRVTVPALNKKARPASVVDVQSFKDGDVALLSVTGLQAPMLTVAPATPDSGATVVATGFAGSVNQIVDAESAPSFNSGNLSGTQTVNGTPFTQISARTSPGMSGGPVLDVEGNVVGTVSWAPAGASTSADFMTTVSSLQSILSGNGVDNTLTTADQAFRDGLTDYYAGRYHDAVTRFDEALALHPTWRMVTDLKLKATAKFPEEVIPVEPAESGFPTWGYLAIAGGVLLLGAAGLGVFLLKRRGAPPAPESPATTTAPMPPPVVAAYPPTAPAPEAVAPTPPPVAPAPEVTVPQAAPVAGTHHAFCPNCGSKHDPAAHYCEECGQPLEAALPEKHEIS